MVVVNVQVAAGAQAHAPAAVLGQGVQHVVEEADARVYADGLRFGLLGGVFEGGAIDAVELGQGAAVEVERELDLGLVGVAVEDGGADALFGGHDGQSVGLVVCGGLVWCCVFQEGVCILKDWSNTCRKDKVQYFLLTYCRLFGIDCRRQRPLQTR